MKKTSSPAASRSALHASPPDTQWEIGPGLAAALYFAVALLFLFPAFLPGRQIYGTDYLGGSYFFFDFIARRFAEGELPKWVPYIYGGLPHLSSPGSTFYPPAALSLLLLPVSRVLAVVFLFQLWIAGLGMYALAREVGCRRWVAFVAGLAFQLTGITTSWIYAGHDGRIIVATFTPLVFFFIHRGVRTGRLAPFAGLAATLGFALLSFQIQNAYYLLLGAAAWAVFCVVHLGVAKRPTVLGRVLAMGIGAVIFGFALASVDFLPFSGYVSASPRGADGGRGYEFSTSYSMPPKNLLGVAVPEATGITVSDPNTGEAMFPPPQQGFKLHTEYLGALVVLLVGVGFAYSRKDRRWWFFFGLALFALSLSFGGFTPLYRVYYALLPGIKRFRAPDLAYFLAAFSFVAMAALTLERLAELREAARARRPGQAEGGFSAGAVVVAAGVLVGLAVLGAAGSAGASAPGAPSVAAGWGRFALFTALLGGALWQWARGRMATRGASVLLALLALGDLWIIGKRFVHTAPPPSTVFAADDVMEFLRAQPGPARVWTMPVPQTYRGAGANGGNYPMLFGIEQAGGEHPNQLQRWNEYIGAGTQTYVDWHNFLGEVQGVETPQGVSAVLHPQPGFLEAANIRYIISTVPLAMPQMRLVHQGPNGLVYENTQALPRAFLVPEVKRVESPDATLPFMLSGQWDPRRVAVVESDRDLGLPGGPLTGEARVTADDPDRVTVRTQASRPALLVLADNLYTGWEAEVDGKPVPIHRTNHTFRGVVVPAGSHEVVFRFHPASLYLGLWVSVGAFAVLALYGLWLLVAARRRPGGAPEPGGEPVAA